MGSLRFFECLFVTLMGSLLGFSQAYEFQVGGKEGWVLHPREDYNHWAGRNRFQVNDTLYFKYKKGSDSVLIVSKDDYYSCNTKKPSQSLTDGNSIFKLNISGPFYFISGNADNCKKGQKMIIVVMAVRHKITPPAAPLAPSPTASSPSPLSPPLPSPPAGSPSPSAGSPSPPAGSPSPSAGSPSPPAGSPSPSAGSPSPPAGSPAPSISSSSQGFTGSVGLVLVASFGVNVILGGIVGLV